MSNASAAARLKRFFGAGDEDAGEGEVAISVRPSHLRVAADSSAERLMEEISSFLLGNRLAVTARNLLVAHSAFSGEDLTLARRIIDRIASGEGVTQDWLDGETPIEDPAGSAKRLTEQLQTSIDGFTATTRSARDTAASYNTELAAHVNEASAAAEGADVTRIVTLAQAMLERARTLEAEMEARQAEAEELKERLARAQRDADIDHLTGLPNRRAFEALFEKNLREAQQQIDQLCVAICDIDHFKRVNDTHGHDTGDRVIRAVAETLARITDDKCHVARHGGEEFVMLFRGLSKTQAREKLDAVRENFSQRRFVNRVTDTPIGQITFSGGVADVFAYANPRDALKAADEALYVAKEQGRNCILSAG
ncbi:GGDEF domain-containing protein [Novosphingobium cyanobacteriorum]|uniref:diguanylate cyclase n=1 Tax=Novosphingobium cyanobacteriorum TaxID=3024215 RepID=A0ABT6CMY0_9SPHN|nr:diguanylate cyclase [Novosphingobium cyanobacteriorum]MDF8333692.1 diguanylate cyclase [Novosphingobium cyanobacteriorum]